MSIFFMLHLGMRLPHFGYKCRMNFIEILILFDRTSAYDAFIIRKTKNQDFKNEKSKKTANDLLIAFIV